MSQTNELSPFEIKNELIALAQSHSERMMLNAGRGNPNFLATIPRHAFNRLADFAMSEAERAYSYLHSSLGGIPQKEGIVGRFDSYYQHNKEKAGTELLQSALAYANDILGFSKTDFLFELVNGYLGCNYPVPPRMLTLCESVVKQYLSQELCQNATSAQQFDCFATEGGTAAMTYLFHSLKVNGLVKSADKIAIITPIFSPYLEIPYLPEFSLESIYIRASEESNWQLPQSEIEKLHDPAIKVLCLVNPSNPPSVKLNQHSLNALAKCIKENRPDLMIITDDVYATFADNFTSLFKVCPRNTVAVYSFSKYFGATGWRLGVIGLHHDNIFDEQLKQLPQDEKKRLDQRYQSLTNNTQHLKFIDRLVADSRTVALNHTAGISTPQQVQMTLFALHCLLDEQDHYKQTAKALIKRRHQLLFDAMNVPVQYDETSVNYYAIIDMELLAEQLYDKNFSTWLTEQMAGFKLLKRLASETGVVLLPGKGFEVDHPSVRVSLANLEEYKYRAIGNAIAQILKEYNQQYKK